MKVMSSFEKPGGSDHGLEELQQKFAKLRERAHQISKEETDVRLKENPKPTEDELYMGAFKEWIEPQVRDAINEMFKKGYATQSSGFQGEEFDVQSVDGLFTIDEQTKGVLNDMRVEVLRGTDIGLPKNKLITIVRFRAKNASLDEIKDQWDAIAAVLPQKLLPAGTRAICDRAEEFREQYAPEHPSLDEPREKYLEYLRENAT